MIKGRKVVIILVLDGCRQDAIYKANLPNINKLIREGLSVKDCSTIFPPSTTTTQTSLITGAYPETTGVTGHFWWDESRNRLEDIGNGRFCQAETIFETLERCTGERGLCLGPRVTWRGSENTIFKKTIRESANFISANRFLMENPYLAPFFRFIRLNFTHHFHGKFDEFIRNFKKDIYPLYYIVLNDPDKTGHIYGPESPEYLNAVENCDEKIGYLIEMIKDRPGETVVIFTSDHGQTTIRKKLNIPELGLEDVGYKISKITPYPIGKEVMIAIFNENRKDSAIATFVTRHVQIWLKNKNDLPRMIDKLKSIEGFMTVFDKEESANFHLKHQRQSDIIASLADGYGFDINDWKGDHGGFNKEDMKVPLVIWGPGIAQATLEKANIIDIAPTVSKILGIEPPREAQGESLL